MALTVDARANTVRGKKGNFPVKNTIVTPFSVEWPALSDEKTSEILQEIQCFFTTNVGSLAKQRSKGKKRATDVKAREKRAVLRSQLALGINEVTRCLEQDKLRLAVVCRSAKPDHMTSHLITLSATRSTPALCLNGLSRTLGPILKLNYVLAIGFKKTTPNDPTIFDDLINDIIAKTPPIHVPWLEYENLTLDQRRKVVTEVVLQTKTDEPPPKKMKSGKNPKSARSADRVPDRKTSESGDARDHDETQQETASKSRQVPDVDEAVTPPGAGSDKRPTVNPIADKQSMKPTKKQKLSESRDSPGLEETNERVSRPKFVRLVTLPVKIIPKELKGKKQLKKQRKLKKKNRKRLGKVKK